MMVPLAISKPAYKYECLVKGNSHSNTLLIQRFILPYSETMKKLLCLIVIAILTIKLQIQSVVEAARAGFSVELIHRDSPLSPFYNRSATNADLLRKYALHSRNRVNHFRAIINQKDIQSTVIANGGGYLMKFSVGTPARDFLAIADTGSDLIWIQCAPCESCYPQGSSPFNPEASSTYQQLPCTSQPCQALPRQTCGDMNTCKYMYSYGDKSYTIGDLSSDTFTFDSASGQKAEFPTSIFGCGHNNAGTFRSPGAGLVGLGGGPLSLISQQGSEIDRRFSYCLLPRSVKSSSKLSFGQEAVISGSGVVSTPLITKSPPTFYYLNLEGISFGDKTVKAASSQGNIIIDSGTTLTILESSLYNRLESIVTETIGLQSVEDPSGSFSLCYQASSGIEVPDMVFQFTGAEVRLKPENTFVVSDGLSCMLIVPSDSISIFGNYAQINFQVEYDLQGKKVSFAPADCSKV